MTTIDGSLSDWNPGARVGLAQRSVERRCRLRPSDGDYFSFGLSASVEIGFGTTFWLNTDRNVATGYQIFGFAGGAEYYIDFAADGTASLYALRAGRW
ncbi:hypothetical protein AB5I41_10900 [Sphingomonas sp. MMS24-JH45]